MKKRITVQIVKEYRLEDLAEIYQTRDLAECRKILEELELSTSFRKRLADNKTQAQLRFLNSVELHKKEVEIAERTLLQCREQKKQVENACERAYQEWKYLEKMCKESYFRWKKEKEKDAHIKEEIEDWEKILICQKQELEKMSKYTLVHPTATLKSIDKRGKTALVCTKYDASRMKLNCFVDQIIDTRGEEYDLNMNFPQRIINQFVSEEEFTSAIEYVKMVAKFYLDEKSYHLLYNSEIIKAMIEYILG